MPKFQLTAVDEPDCTIQFEGPGYETALYFAQRKGFHHAHLSEDGKPRCTIRLTQGDGAGFWVIDPPAAEPEPSAA